MIDYLLRRLAYAAVMLVLISFVSFLIIELPPGDYLTMKLVELRERGDRSAEQRIEQYRARYGLDKPLLQRYWIWISHFVQGDFGESFRYERPVSEVMGDRLSLTIVLALITLLLTWLIAIPVGVYSATHQYTFGDQVVTVLTFLGMGIPSFLLALIVLYFAVIVLGLEVGGLFSHEFQDAAWSWAKVVDLMKHIWMPALIGAITGTAGLIRIMRGNLLDTLGQPFIEAARARGLKKNTVTWKHAVRMSITPLIVILGSESLPGIISGNALMATVLNLPTIGPLYVTALQQQDMYMAGTVLIFITFLLLIGNILADLGLAALDPRVRLD